MLDDGDLAQATELYYSASGRWADRRSALSGLMEWEESVIETWFPPAGRILVPAAGAGREVLPLASRGYEVVGFDPSRDLVDLGLTLIEEAGAPAGLVWTSPDTVPELPDPFDGVLFGWGGISHVIGTDQRIAMLTDIRSLMRAGAPLLISFLDRRDPSRSIEVTARVARFLRRLRRSGDTVELGDTFYGSFDHHFTIDEMAQELRAAGFEERFRAAAPYAHIVAVAS